MTQSTYLASVLSMLGEPTASHEDPAAWEALEDQLGTRLPEDYKTIIDTYGPVRINGHLTLHHPATQRWNLGRWIRETAEAWSEVPWDEVDLEADPRPSLGIPDMRFGAADGLIPAVSSDRDEAVFLAQGAEQQGWRVFVSRDDEFFEYPMNFAEWLYRYLIGEDMAGPNSSVFYPGPVRFESLPMNAHGRTSEWHGPDRGM
ncbi:SMI1/KNR4 family protein [Streptomyces rimosus]|uniref:SMI1/KNR4 family protein n=1 Tax=Streptomyces rimosus TaxID=1927 RepID=UPI0031D6A5E5